MIRALRALPVLLTRAQKRDFILLQGLFLISAFVEVAGIASIAPFIALLSNPEIIETNAIVNGIYTELAFESVNEFFFAFAALIMVTITTSNLISAFTMWRLFGFSMRVGAALQTTIYKNYIHNDFVFFSMNNSSRLTSTITQEVPRFVYNVVQPLCELISKLFVVLIILIGLIYIDILMAFLAFLIVGGTYLFIFKILRWRLVAHGNTITIINDKKIKLLNESLGGIKEVKLLGTEDWYEAQVRDANEKVLRSGAFISLAGDMPRFIVETATFLAILFLALYLLYNSGSPSEVISVLSLYAMAGYKLLPSMQTIYKSFSLIKANGGIVPQLVEEVANSALPQNGQATEQADLSEIKVDKIRLDGVNYRYPEASENALTNLNLTIEPNTIVSFVGSSGAGKSTAVDVILGLLTPDKGQLIVGDTVVTKGNVKSWQKHLGYVPQSIFIVDDTITANIAFGIPPETIDIERVKQAARLANIDAFIEALPEKYDFHVGERGSQLSGGQRQRVGIARALYHNPEVIIFDEATSALDSVTESQIMKEIKKLSSFKTIIMIAHRLSTVINSDKIVYFTNGSIADEGTYQELLNGNKGFASFVKHDEKKHDE